jgi:hypothetical protein
MPSSTRLRTSCGLLGDTTGNRCIELLLGGDSVTLEKMSWDPRTTEGQALAFSSEVTKAGSALTMYKPSQALPARGSCSLGSRAGPSQSPSDLGRSNGHGHGHGGASPVQGDQHPRCWEGPISPGLPSESGNANPRWGRGRGPTVSILKRKREENRNSSCHGSLLHPEQVPSSSLDIQGSSADCLPSSAKFTSSPFSSCALSLSLSLSVSLHHFI